MSSNDGPDIGCVENNVDGDVQSRTVQTEGRLNIPDEYFSHIGVEEGEEVFVGVDGDQIIIKEATVDSVGVMYMMDAIYKVAVTEDEKDTELQVQEDG